MIHPRNQRIIEGIAISSNQPCALFAREQSHIVVHNINIQVYGVTRTGLKNEIHLIIVVPGKGEQRLI